MIEKVILKLGFACNNNCRFCAVAHKRKWWGDRTTKEAKQRLKQIKDPKNKKLILSGGEVTIREDVVEIIQYAKSLGFKPIGIQTNGRMCSSLDFARKLVKAGVNHFLVSIHGWNEKSQDFLTRSPGSFIQTTAGIANLAKLNVGFKTNTVINTVNYKHLPELVRLLIGLEVESLQISFVHGLGNAWDNFEEIVPSYIKTAPYIHQSIDLCQKHNIDLEVDAVPFCFMKGYEKHIYEKKGDGFVQENEIVVDEIARIISNFYDWRRKKGRIHGPPCKKCKYSKICEGPYRDYIQKRGWKEFKPVK